MLNYFPKIYDYELFYSIYIFDGAVRARMIDEIYYRIR